MGPYTANPPLAALSEQVVCREMIFAASATTRGASNKGQNIANIDYAIGVLGGGRGKGGYQVPQSCSPQLSAEPRLGAGLGEISLSPLAHWIARIDQERDFRGARNNFPEDFAVAIILAIALLAWENTTHVPSNPGPSGTPGSTARDQDPPVRLFVLALNAGSLQCVEKGKTAFPITVKPGAAPRRLRRCWPNENGAE